MKFLLYTTTYGKSGSIQLSRPGFWVPALLVLLALLVAAARLGFQLAQGQDAAEISGVSRACKVGL